MRFVHTLAAAVAVAISLTGCGSSSYASRVRDTLGATSAALTRYNNATTPGLAAQSQACKQASDALSGQGGALNEKAPNPRSARVARAARRALRNAKLGFAECTRAAAAGNYPLMVQALDHLTAANRWIARARALDR